MATEIIALGFALLLAASPAAAAAREAPQAAIAQGELRGAAPNHGVFSPQLRANRMRLAQRRRGVSIWASRSNSSFGNS